MTRTWQRFVALGLASSFSLLVGAVAGGSAIAQDSDTSDPQETDTPETDTSDPESGNGDIEQPDEFETSRFSCQLDNGEYTVMYSPRSQPGESYAWATPGDMGSAWPAERRCDEISRRLESYRPDGLLELQTGRENGYNTVCVTTEAVPRCRIVFTVPVGQDPEFTRDSVFNNLALADQGQSTEGVSTFVEGDSIFDDLDDVLGLPSGSGSFVDDGDIDLRPFLDAADGGTGTQLNPSSGRPLNPDNF